MILKHQKELANIRGLHPGKTIVFCSGVFDLTHAGHVLFFEECKALGDILVVLAGNDEGVRNYKGVSRPILNEYVRIKMIDSLKPVDYCLLGDTSKHDPLAFVRAVLEILKPDIYVVDDDAFNTEERERVASQNSVKLVSLKRWCPREFENISTSTIIQKIQRLGSDSI